jgi:hypothetical protein
MVYTIGFNCINCKKCFSTNGNLKKHLTTCKGESLLSNECKYCHKKLLNSSNKSRHQKICKQRPIDNNITNNINNIDNSITNSIDNSIHNDNSNTINNITINNYNNTNLDYLTIDEKHKLVMRWLNEGLEGIILKSLLELHFNVEHPENKNVRMNKTNFIEYLDDINIYQGEPAITFFHNYIEKMEVYTLDAIDYLKPNFKVLCKLHKTVSSFLLWKDIGYDDIKDKIDIIYTKKEKKEVLNNIFKLFKKIIKRQELFINK